MRLSERTREAFRYIDLAFWCSETFQLCALRPTRLSYSLSTSKHQCQVKPRHCTTTPSPHPDRNRASAQRITQLPPLAFWTTSSTVFPRHPNRCRLPPEEGVTYGTATLALLTYPSQSAGVLSRQRLDMDDRGQDKYYYGPPADMGPPPPPPKPAP